MKKLFNIFCAISIVVMIWMVASFAEINCKNLNEGSKYNPANFFQITTSIFSND